MLIVETEVTLWAVVGRERDWVSPYWLEVSWTLGPGRQKLSLWEGRWAVITSLGGHFRFVWIGKDILRSPQMTSPIVPSNILAHRTKFSTLWVNLLVDVDPLYLDPHLFLSALILSSFRIAIVLDAVAQGSIDSIICSFYSSCSYYWLGSRFWFWVGHGIYNNYIIAYLVLRSLLSLASMSSSFFSPFWFNSMQFSRFWAPTHSKHCVGHWGYSSASLNVAPILTRFMV